MKHFRAISLMTAATCLALAAMFAPAAGAETFGQVASWGGPGTGNAQFLSPGMLGVDPVDGSVYGGDITSNNANYRIQKLSASGEFKGSVPIPRFEDEATKLIPLALHGIAVDHAKERIYVIQGCKVTSGSSVCQKNTKVGTTFNAKRVLAFKTTPEGGALTAATGFNLPEGSEELYQPQAIAVDPSNNDLVIMAEDSAKHIVIQRFSSTGTPGARFVDSTNTLKPSGREATSIAVGPDGVTYTMTGAPTAEGTTSTRGWELPANLSTVQAMPIFAAAAESEEWQYGLQREKSPSLLGGPQLAISPDGSTLYWKENLTPSSEGEAGGVLVHGYSLDTQKTTTFYGGGSGTCEITTSSAAIGATGSKVVVFDYGPAGESPAYGDRMLTFGPGGSGCPTPVTKFTINGLEQAEVNVSQGTQVTFNASGSELFDGFRKELVWKFGDGTEETVPTTIDSETEAEVEAVPTTTHTYSSSGKFTVSLEIKLKNSPIANLAPVQHVVNVTGGSPTFQLKVKKEGTGSGTVTSEPAAINCGTTCEAPFAQSSSVLLTGVAGIGSKAVVWTGCGEVTGENKCKVTMSAAKEVTATFDLAPTFQLKVNKVGTGSGTVTSSPAGINCGATCEAPFAQDSSALLTGTPSAGSKAVVWTGCGEVTGENKCKVTMSAAKEVTATFDLAPTFQLKVSKAGAGSGTVTSTPSGINCGSTCSAAFGTGVEVTLAAAPVSGSKFSGWSGACAGTGTCKVTMSAAKEVTATFDSEPVQPPSGGGGSTPSGGGGGGSTPPPNPPVETKKPLTPKQKALAKCKKLKGKAKAKCIKNANSAGKHKKHRRGRG